MNARYPVVPEFITVHLGAPDDTAADNVTVGFADYIKNVASSEVYPTWPEAALRANIYAQISFALNRIYTEHYRARGYDFDITNSTAYDQSFVRDRDIFDNIGLIVDEIFNDYIVRRGYIEPLFAVYCNGTTVTCDGLSQWGSVTLANDGLGAYDILTQYYGDDIDIVENAPVQALEPSPPNILLGEGSAGNDVKFIQVRLNRISTNYPSIPKIPAADGVYDTATGDAVREFQRIFSLNQTGMVDRSTWYKIQSVYNAVKRLSELDSEGLRDEDVSNQFKDLLSEGDSGENIKTIQYYLRVIADFNPSVPSPPLDGYFGESTTEAVKTFQQENDLPVTGIVDSRTWNMMFDVYLGMINSAGDEIYGGSTIPFPGVFLKYGSEGTNVEILQKYINAAHELYPQIPPIDVDGVFGTDTRNAVYAAQAVFGLMISGVVGPILWNELADAYAQVDGNTRSEYQYSGEVLSEGDGYGDGGQQ